MILLVIPARVLINRWVRIFAIFHFCNTRFGPAIARPQVHRVGVHEREVHERRIFFARDKSCKLGVRRFVPSDSRTFSFPLKITEKCLVGDRFAINPVQRKIPLARRNDLDANTRILMFEFTLGNFKIETRVLQISRSVFGSEFI